MILLTICCLMAGVFLVLLEMTTRLMAACPSSCVVCSEDVTVCQGLPYILATPETTRALIVTDGYITSIEFSNLSMLINLTLLRLSSNSIVEIQNGVFDGFTDLKALVLDQNQISSSTISNTTFSKLQRLELLVLSSNTLSSIYGIWFNNMSNLIKLQLNGNQLTNLTDSSFGTTSLYQLKNLDLSNNVISYIDRYAFLGLPQLQELNLARNNLKHISDAFSTLTQLIVLNLEQNQWNCTCELQEFSAFLRNYISSSARILKNSKYIECWNSKHSILNNVLELTDENCLPTTENMTLILEDKSNNYYRRDVILVAVFCFAGAVGITCLILAIINWKLQLSTTNQHTENCCCEHLNESECALGRQTNYFNKAYQDCHMTQENETNVMSIVGPGNDIPLMQRNSQRPTFHREYKSKVLDLAFQNIQREKKISLKGGCFVCLNCGQLQSYPNGSYGNILATDEADILSQNYQQILTQPMDIKSAAQWEEMESKVLQKLSKLKEGMDENQLKRRCSKTKAAFAGKELQIHLTQESYQPLSDTEENRLTHHWERHDDRKPLATSKGVASEEHGEQRTLNKHRSQLGDHSVLLEQSMNISLYPDNSLICKYMDCEQIHNSKTQTKEIHMKNVKCAEEQTQPDNTVGNCFMTDDNRHVSLGAKNPQAPKTVSFYIPELKHSQDAIRTASGGTKSQKKQSNTENQKREMFASKSNREQIAVVKGEAGEKSQTAKAKATNRKFKIRTRGQDYLHVKINLHPFRKVRVHPEDTGTKEHTVNKKKKGGNVQNQPDKALFSTFNKDIKKKQKKQKLALLSVTEEHFERNVDGVQSMSHDNQLPTRRKHSKRKERGSIRPDQALDIKCNASSKITQSRDDAAQGNTENTSSSTIHLTDTHCHKMSVLLSTADQKKHDNLTDGLADTSPNRSHGTEVDASEAQCSNHAALKERTTVVTESKMPSMSQVSTRFREEDPSALMIDNQKGIPHIEHLFVVGNLGPSQVTGDLSVISSMQYCNGSPEQGTTVPADSCMHPSSRVNAINKESLGSLIQANQPGMAEMETKHVKCDFNVNPSEEKAEEREHHRNQENQKEGSGIKNRKVTATPVACINTNETQTVQANLLRGDSQITTTAPEPTIKSHETVLSTAINTRQNMCSSLDSETSISPPSCQVSGNLKRNSTDNISVLNRPNTGVPVPNGTHQNPPNDETESDAQTEAQETNTISEGAPSEAKQTGPELDEPLKSADANPVKLATILMVLNIKKSQEAINMSQGNNTGLQINSNGQVHKDNVPNMQEVQSNQPDKVNSARQVSEMPLEEGEVLSMLQELKDISSEAENEALLIPSRINEAENTAPKPTQQPITAGCDNESPPEEQQRDATNSNNNHSSSLLPLETLTSSIGLSDNSKLIILGDNPSESMNIKQYLTERGKHMETLQNTLNTLNESHPISREGSQKKKICLVLPEQTHSRTQNINNRKIK